MSGVPVLSFITVKVSVANPHVYIYSTRTPHMTLCVICREKFTLSHLRSSDQYIIYAALIAECSSVESKKNTS
jgi:hypothetical protein